MLGSTPWKLPNVRSRGLLWSRTFYGSTSVCAEFPFKGVVSLCGGCGNQWEILLSSSVNSRQMTEFCDRAGALLYKQPSWRENAVAPALLSAEGKASYCRCRHILAHKHCMCPPQCNPHTQMTIRGMRIMSYIKYQFSFLWAGVINKHTIVKSHHWTGGWFINCPVTRHYAVKEKYISIDGKKKKKCIGDEIEWRCKI